MLVDIIPAVKTHGGNAAFSYLVPKELERAVSIRSLVEIPFGKRKVRGIITKIHKNSSSTFRLKAIDKISDFVLPDHYLFIAKWVADYYLCSLGEAISLFLPPVIQRPRRAKEESKVAISKPRLKLSEEQKYIFDQLKKDFGTSSKPALIHGVTGSGKTEIYISLAKEAIAHGKQVIVLVPEIMLTPQTMERFCQVFGQKVALMHSALSKSEKYECFRDFYSGAKQIIIGPRSALLIPSSRIGLIIIDEEQEDSFKQEQSPRYHAVALAEFIAKRTKALLVLGSATPRVETFYKTQTEEYRLFQLEKRYNKNDLPLTSVVDLRDEIKAGNFSLISRLLKKEIDEVLNKKKQALLFLNRRGMATFVSCRDCGYVIKCKNCSVPLIFYVNNKEDSLLCHHCGYREKISTHCPSCKSLRIKYFGAGIDKVMIDLRHHYPEARIAKIDSTTMLSKKDYGEFYHKLINREIDLVVGTQMIAKGLDIPNVDLVGIISADTGLHLPHYKASEKTFQIITQVAGRSGRRADRGKTVIQTYWPESGSISAAADGHFTEFYEKELAERLQFVYPPYVHIVRVLSEDLVESKAISEIQSLARRLDQAKIDYVGPGPCFHHKLKGRFRHQIIIKIKKLPDQAISKIYSEFSGLTFDVDPTNLL